MLKRLWGHFSNVMKHKWIVFYLCCKAGIIYRGIVHDISKFSLTEFWQGVKYYGNGARSPIQYAKQDYGYSKAWLHHKGRNKHHPEYWYDPVSPISKPIIPYCYTCEMICDQLAAGMVYQGKNWNKEYQLHYWEQHMEQIPLNEILKEFVTKVLTKVAKEGIAVAIDKNYLKKEYEQCIKKQTTENLGMDSQKN